MDAHLNLGFELGPPMLVSVLNQGIVHERVVRQDEDHFRMTCTVHFARNGQGGLQIMLRLHFKGDDPADAWKT